MSRICRLFLTISLIKPGSIENSESLFMFKQWTKPTEDVCLVSDVKHCFHSAVKPVPALHLNGSPAPVPERLTVSLLLTRRRSSA